MKVEVNIKTRLDGFTLEQSFCSTGKRLGILGASGSGKSLTLKTIAGIETPDSGTILVGDQCFYDSSRKINIPARKRKIGYLFQNYALFPNMTVGANIMVGMEGAKKEKQYRLQHYLKQFSLTGLENRYPDELSGGQKQRVALARIMAYEPDVILLDEPFSAMDGWLKDQLKQEMEHYLQEYGGKLIIVSHDLEELYRFSDELLVLSEGRAIAFGPTKDLFERPEQLVTAKLMGCKNLSRVRSVNRGQIEAIDWGILLPYDNTKKQVPSHVGIYAEHLSFLSKEPADGDVLIYPIQQMRLQEKAFSIEAAAVMKNGKDPLYFELTKKQAKEIKQQGMLAFKREHLVYIKDKK